jgi:hypothetical protein
MRFHSIEIARRERVRSIILWLWRVSVSSPAWRLSLSRQLSPLMVMMGFSGYRAELGSAAAVAIGHHDARGITFG